MIEEKNTQPVCHSQSGADQEGNPEFLEHDAENIPELDFIQGDSTDDQGGTLGTAVSACVHQHGNEGHEKRDGGEGVFVSGDNGSCYRSRKHQKKQPQKTVFAWVNTEVSKYVFSLGFMAAMMVNVLCRLVHQ